jgi:hypothetical protein
MLSFFVCGGLAFLLGFFGKVSVRPWCFCGQTVVFRMAKMDS